MNPGKIVGSVERDVDLRFLSGQCGDVVNPERFCCSACLDSVKKIRELLI